MGVEEAAASARRAKSEAEEADRRAREWAAQTRNGVLAAAVQELQKAAKICREERFGNEVEYCMYHREPSLFVKHQRPGPLARAWYFGHEVSALLTNDGTLMFGHFAREIRRSTWLCVCASPPQSEGLPLLTECGDAKEHRDTSGVYFDPTTAKLSIRIATEHEGNHFWRDRDFFEWIESGIGALFRGVTWGASDWGTSDGKVT